MNGSALDIYVAAAFRGLTSIFNGKLRSFRAVSAALLKHFLSSGSKTFEEIGEYLAVARLHPMGRHGWTTVSCRLSSFTSLSAQKERVATT